MIRVIQWESSRDERGLASIIQNCLCVEVSLGGNDEVIETDLTETGPARQGRLARHLAWLDRQPLVIFTLLMTVYSMLARIVPALLLVIVERAGLTLPEVSSRLSPAELAFGALIWAPLFETFLGQWLPIYIALRLKAGIPAQLAVSVVIFTLSHLPDALAAVMAIPPGIALAYTYIRWRDRGKHLGYWATALTHFWFNAIATALGLVLR